ncbi:MAG: AMP-binding protein [Candidatus Cloacimonetes bacterium]|nr:AMP-binding protein [Candidatus Cloacimonadota bacterium]
MTDKLFLFDYKTNQAKKYSDLITDINNTGKIYRYCCTRDLYTTFLNIVTAILHNKNLILLDSDFSELELSNLQINQTDLILSDKVDNLCISNLHDLIEHLKSAADWQLTLYTSGTTGIPKQVVHKLSALTRAVRMAEKHSTDIWGYAYNPTHIAGLQVFFQALFNANTLVNLFEAGREQVLSLIQEYGITNISATPTFFRLLLPLKETYPSVKKLTSGGEKFDSNLSSQLLQMFPNAKLRNVYASTEAGTILESRDDTFSIIDSALCKIQDGELYIHRSLLGIGSELNLNDDEWYATGDLVEVIKTEPLRFRFLSRRNEMVNVGGYKVNPYEVEQAIEQHPLIKQVS